jgi:hypothetical protein
MACTSQYYKINSGLLPIYLVATYVKAVFKYCVTVVDAF